MPNPNHRFLVAIFALCVAHAACTAAHGATCNAGYYLKDGECADCNPSQEPYYCPGDDMRYPCPETNTDYTQFGYTYLRGSEAVWANRIAPSVKSCMCDMNFRDEYGNKFLLEDSFNGENYWGDRKLWYVAGSGFYLSGYSWTSSYNWYTSAQECTNAPEHAHYTGPGTPDAPDGSIKDANDCPWECDDGWGRHGDVCVPLCHAGIQHIKTGAGLIFNLYPVAYSTPALHIKYNDQTCYGTLAAGAGDNAINVRYSGQTFHTIN